MKVAYVCADPGVPVFGCKGGSIHVQSVVRALIARGHEVTMFARRLGGAAPAGLESVRVWQLPKPPSGQSAERERFLLDSNAELSDRLGSETGLGLVYERHALFSHAPMEFARDAGIPGLLEVNAPLVEEQRQFRTLTLVEEAERSAERAFSAAGAVLAVSSPLAERLERETAARGRVHDVPNGVDVTRFSAPVEPCISRVPGVTTVGFVGTLKPWHGVEQLVDAILQLRRDSIPVRLLIVGDGPGRSQIEAACAGDLESVVLTGAVEPDRVPGLLASMDIAVAPYPRLDEFYFSPLKIYEYMAAGVATVASASGQICDVIDCGSTGLLYEPGDADGLRGKIRELALDAALRRRIGDRAQAVVRNRHGWDSVADRILELADAVKGVPA